MTEKRRVHSAASTHSSGGVKQGNSEYEVENHQKSMMLIDPEDISGGNTHSGAQPKMKGAKRPTYAALIDEQRTPGGKISQIPNDIDPAAGYLETETGMPVIYNVEASDESDEDDFEDTEVESEFEDLADTDEVDAEFEDEGDEVEAEFGEDDDMESLDGPDVEADAADGEVEEEVEDQPLTFENDMDSSEALPSLMQTLWRMTTATTWHSQLLPTPFMLSRATASSRPWALPLHVKLGWQTCI